MHLQNNLDQFAPLSFGRFVNGSYSLKHNTPGVIRVAKAVLPLLALCNPAVGRVTALASGIQAVQVHVQQAYDSRSVTELARGALLIATLATPFFNSRTSTLITLASGGVDAFDLFKGVYRDLFEQKYVQALEKFLRLAVVECSLLVSYETLPGSLLALSFCQAAVCVPQAWRDYKEKGVLEAAVTGLLACIRLHQTHQYALTLLPAFPQQKESDSSTTDSSCSSSSDTSNSSSSTDSSSSSSSQSSSQEPELHHLSNTVEHLRTTPPETPIRIYTHIVNPQEYPQLRRIASAWKHAARNRQSTEAHNPNVQARLGDCESIARSVASDCKSRASTSWPDTQFAVCTVTMRDNTHKVAGIMEFSVDRENVWVYYLVTHPQNIGAKTETKGAGSVLLKRAQLEAQAANLNNVQLCGLDRARSFYLQQGFVPIEPGSNTLTFRVQPYKADPQRDQDVCG